MSGCAYHFGGGDRSLPQGYKQLTIPIFKNLTQEVGIEVAFTNSLKQEFERSKVARLMEPSQAEVVLEGEIKSLTYGGTGKTEGGSLPTGTVLASSYDIYVVCSLTLRRQSDRSVLWSGDFSRGRSYGAPAVTLAGINTVNPLYNLSARRQNIDIIAGDMMAEAHDRITENF